MALSSSKLTAQQQAQVADFSKLIRTAAGTKAKYLATIGALNAAFLANQGVASIFPLLLDADIIDDGNNLSGASPLTKADIAVLFSQISTDIAAWPLASNLTLWAQAAGINVLP